VAVCDLQADRAQAAVKACKQAGRKLPEVYVGDEHLWEKLVERDDIDAVYIAVPWNWHVPMALRAMEQGEHALIEVAAAFSIEDGWRLVDASERWQKHCV